MLEILECQHTTIRHPLKGKAEGYISEIGDWENEVMIKLDSGYVITISKVVLCDPIEPND